ncbi:MAG: sulfatase [Kiritimatiellae bacterium]|nr:sulfatase [Kiritimatiellia bacterium]
MKDRPNILYLHTHDLGRYCEPYGYAIPAPNLRKLAERGVLFRQAFNTAPTCSPSRSGLLTGRWPHCNGMFGLTGQGWRLNDYSQHLARFLQGHGYETVLVGANHVAPRPELAGEETKALLGYSQILKRPKDPGKGDNWAAEGAAEFLAQKHDKPFFLAVGFGAPHRYNPGDRKTFSSRYPTEPEGVDDRYCLPMPHLIDCPTTRNEMANFKMGVAVMDEQFGLVLDALARSEHADNTVVICTTDHGPGIPDMKCTVTDRGTGVMLVLAGPDPFGGGRVLDALVSHIDIYPTVCELIGADRPAWLQGKSMMPLLRGESDTINACIFAEHNYHGDYRPQRAARTERYKYIRRFRTGVGVGVDRGPTDAMMRAYGWAERPQPEEELHDLVFDPHEAANVIDDPRYAEAAAEMRRRLETWMEETDDPVRHDAVPPPPDAAEKG